VFSGLGALLLESPGVSVYIVPRQFTHAVDRRFISNNLRGSLERVAAEEVSMGFDCRITIRRSPDDQFT
jgi:hypothetical protein